MTATLILERTFDSPLTVADVYAGSLDSKWCFDLYRVVWRGSMLALDGRTMICRFSAPDMESARAALRKASMDASRLWLGTVHESPPAAEPNVVIERSFAAPVRIEDIASLAAAKPWCYETHNVKHVCSYHAANGKRMLCFYAAPDAEAVRIAQRETAAPFDVVWAGSPIAPA